MAQCSAINSALGKKGWNNTTLASQTGLNPQYVDDILSGKVKPTKAEFGLIASRLDLSNPADHAAQYAV